MVSESDIQRQLGILYRIQGLTSPWPELEKLIQEARLTEAQEEIRKRVGSIQKLIEEGSFSGHSGLWHPLESRLTTEEYVLPPELEEVHPKITREVSSRKQLENLPYGGLLLYGKDVGTGKSEYVRFLATQVNGNVRFVVANLDRISGNPNPGTTLKTLYLELDAVAKEDGLMYVVLLDEFERMVTKHSTLHSAVKQEMSDRSSDRGMNVYERRETSETLQLDDVGAQTFAIFKTLVSGGENVQFVYTIATSNQSTYDKSLLRRLRPVKLEAFGMSTFSADGNVVPDYSDYRTKLPRVLRILQATYFRDNGKRSNHLDKILEEIEEKFDGLQEAYVVDSSKVQEVSGVAGIWQSIRTIPAQKAVRNNSYLQVLLEYFSFDIRGTRQMEFDQRNRFAFAGYFEEPIEREREDHIRQAFYIPQDKTSDEHALMRNLTPDKVAKWYKDNPDSFKTYDSTKTLIGQMIFPQLRKLTGPSK